MKVYSITTPDVLERAADIVKWPGDAIKVRKYISLWKKTMERDPDHTFPVITLELGRQAQLVRTHDGHRTQMANLYITGAKQFIEYEGLVEQR